MTSRAMFLFVVFASGCSDRALHVPDDLTESEAQPLSVQLTAPLSTARVTSRRPTLRWRGANATAKVELCADRACTHALGTATTSADGMSARPDATLPLGVVFWRVRSGTEISPTWELFVGAEDAAVDTSWGSAGDYDGDGRAELAVAAWGSGGWVVDVYSALPAQTDVSRVLGPFPGTAITSLSSGDINGDGYADLVVGSLAEGKSGTLDVFFGGEHGLADKPSLTRSEPGNLYAWRVAIVGDYDGDGYADIVAGGRLPVNDHGQSLLSSLQVYRGSPKDLRDPLPLAMTNTAWIGFGLWIATADFNGDGYGDFALGLDSGVAGDQRTDIYLGGPNASAPSRSFVGARFSPFLTSAGDVDGDGYADLAPATASVECHRGGPGGVGDATAFDALGDKGVWATASVGDLDGDGYDETLVEASGGIYGSDYILRGGPTGFASPAEASGLPATTYAPIGIGDLDGDGVADVAGFTSHGLVVVTRPLDPTEAPTMVQAPAAQDFTTAYLLY